MANADNVTIAISGNLWKVTNVGDVDDITVAPTGTDYGYISADGIELPVDRSNSETRAWQGQEVVRTRITDATAEISFKLIENTQAVRELYYGSTETAGVIKFNAANSVTDAFVIDWIDNKDGRNYKVRYVIPSATVTDLEPLTLSNDGDEPVGFGITLKCNTTQGVGDDEPYHYMVITDEDYEEPTT